MTNTFTTICNQIDTLEINMDTMERLYGILATVYCDLPEDENYDERLLIIMKKLVSKIGELQDMVMGVNDPSSPAYKLDLKTNKFKE